MGRKNHKWAPGTIARYITQIRMILWFAYDKRFIDFVPKIEAPPQELRERSRRDLTEDEYNKMIDWAWQRKEKLRNAKDKKDRMNSDNAYQFFIWMMVISYTGIRPPNGSVEKNLLKWESYKTSKDELGNTIRVFERQEKNAKPYRAAVMPEAVPWFDALKRLQKDRGIDSPYMFVHTHDRKGKWRKGEPIKNFKRVWQTMLQELSLSMPTGTPQSKTLVPYSLRGYYITCRIRYGNMRLIDLAEACGTSMRMIEQTYYAYTTERNYDSLISGTMFNENAPLQYDEHGDLMLPDASNLIQRDNGNNIQNIR